MNIQISDIPKGKIDLFSPFVIKGESSYAFGVVCTDILGLDAKFIQQWMDRLNAFPIYFCSDIPSGWESIYESACQKFTINYSYLSTSQDKKMSITEIHNSKQFLNIFPFFIEIGNMEDLVLWSTSKNVFTLEERRGNDYELDDRVVANMEPGISVFSILNSGLTLAVVSSSSKFSTYEDMCQTLPVSTVPVRGVQW